VKIFVISLLFSTMQNCLSHPSMFSVEPKIHYSPDDVIEGITQSSHLNHFHGLLIQLSDIEATEPLIRRYTDEINGNLLYIFSSAGEQRQRAMLAAAQGELDSLISVVDEE
jgi:hypothetical protein